MPGLILKFESVSRWILNMITGAGNAYGLTLFYTKRKIEEMQAGEELEVIADDPTAKETIPRWSREHGHEVMVLEEQENYFRIVVRKV